MIIYDIVFGTSAYQLRQIGRRDEFVRVRELFELPNVSGEIVRLQVIMAEHRLAVERFTGINYSSAVTTTSRFAQQHASMNTVTAVDVLILSAVYIYASGNYAITGSNNGLSPVRYLNLNQCWVIASWNIVNEVQWNYKQNTKIFVQENDWRCRLRNDAHFVSASKS